MKAYLALTKIDVKLALRDKQTLFFTYLFPLIFFFFLSTMLHAERGGGTIALIVTDVLVIGILGNGFFGAGIRAVQEREAGILRRYKVTPITPVPLLVASLTTGLLLYIPAVFLTFGLARMLYGMAVPEHPLSLFLFLAIGAVAFRAVGLIVAAVANSMAESTLLVQLLYMPMLFLSGAMFPMSMMPRGVQTASQFLPATYLVSGIQSIFTQQDTLAANWKPAGGLLITLALSVLVASRLFRWEKEEKLKSSSKLWVLGVLAPFIVLGVYQFRTSEQIVKNRTIWRQMQRDDSFLIRNARIFVGDGRVIEQGSVLVRKGKIDKVFEGSGPDGLKADVVEASGKTVMPGLIDVHVHLGAPGGIYTIRRTISPSTFPSAPSRSTSTAASRPSGAPAISSICRSLCASAWPRATCSARSSTCAVRCSRPKTVTGPNTSSSWTARPRPPPSRSSYGHRRRPTKRARRSATCEPRAWTPSKRCSKPDGRACCSREWTWPSSARSPTKRTARVFPPRCTPDPRAT
jgi:ABC-type multidrug transport system permease subunit